jgi:hypothetical protein
MAEYFGHERLKVYQKGMPFASMRKTLLDDLPRRVAACSGNSQRRPGMTSRSHTSSHKKQNTGLITVIQRFHRYAVRVFTGEASE